MYICVCIYICVSIYTHTYMYYKETKRQIPGKVNTLKSHYFGLAGRKNKTFHFK